jgi:hypothetical protein
MKARWGSYRERAIDLALTHRLGDHDGMLVRLWPRRVPMGTVHDQKTKRMRSGLVPIGAGIRSKRILPNMFFSGRRTR